MNKVYILLGRIFAFFSRINNKCQRTYLLSTIKHGKIVRLEERVRLRGILCWAMM